MAQEHSRTLQEEIMATTLPLYQVDSEMQSCIENCMDCASVCTNTLTTYCLKVGGHHAGMSHVQLMMDCATICQTCTNFMLRGSGFHSRICGLCAEICDRCAADCEKFSDDSQMLACAAACRRCAESCRSMAMAMA